MILFRTLIILIFLNSCKEDGLLQPITILDTDYKLVKCTFEYIDYNDQSNNISYFGYPYNKYGVTTNFKNDGANTILVNKLI